MEGHVQFCGWNSVTLVEIKLDTTDTTLDCLEWDTEMLSHWPEDPRVQTSMDSVTRFGWHRASGVLLCNRRFHDTDVCLSTPRSTFYPSVLSFQVSVTCGDEGSSCRSLRLTKRNLTIWTTNGSCRLQDFFARLAISQISAIAANIALVVVAWTTGGTPNDIYLAVTTAMFFIDGIVERAMIWQSDAMCLWLLKPGMEHSCPAIPKYDRSGLPNKRD